MRSRNGTIVVLAVGLMLLTITSALAGDQGTPSTETDPQTDTWSQTFLATDLTGLNIRTLDSAAMATDLLTVEVADRAKDVTSTDTWDVSVSISNIEEVCVTECVDGTQTPLSLDNAHADLAPGTSVSTEAVPLVGDAINSATVTPGGTNDLSAARTMFSGGGYQDGTTAIGLYTGTATLSYDWDGAMSAVGTPGDYVGTVFNSTVTVTLIE